MDHFSTPLNSIHSGLLRGSNWPIVFQFQTQRYAEARLPTQCIEKEDTRAVGVICCFLEAVKYFLTEYLQR